MEFETKKALLEHLGKNGKDNKLVDRMIRRGEVRILNGMYIYDGDEELGWYKARVAELEAKIFSLGKEEGKNTGLQHSEGELEEAKIQWEHYKERCEKYKKALNLVIHETYVVAKAKLGNKMEEEAEFREAILGAVREKIGE